MGKWNMDCSPLSHEGAKPTSNKVIPNLFCKPALDSNKTCEK